MLIDNVKTVLKRPMIGLEFAAYKLNQLMRRGHALRRLPGNVMITGFSGFTEFHACTDFVTSAEMEFLTHCPMADGAILDVGANLGVVSIILARRFADRPLHAFEPNPSTCLALRENLRLNRCGNVAVHDTAVCDHANGVLFNANPKNRGTTSITEIKNSYAIHVPSQTLDEFAAREGIERIAFLKIDVEGYEPLVLRGAERLLAEQRVATVYFEVCPALAVRAGFRADEAGRMLQDYRYRLFRLDALGKLQAARCDEIAGVVSENWVAMRP